MAIVKPFEAVGSANAVTTLTIPARPGEVVQIRRLMASYSGAPTGGRLRIWAGADTTQPPGLDMDISGAGLTWVPLDDTDGDEFGVAGDQVTIQLTAGGAGVVGKISAGISYR